MAETSISRRVRLSFDWQKPELCISGKKEMTLGEAVALYTAVMAFGESQKRN
jgi:hypothetical protein